MAGGEGNQSSRKGEWPGGEGNQSSRKEGRPDRQESCVSGLEGKMNFKEENGKLLIELGERIDTHNAPEVEKELLQILTGHSGLTLLMDASKLEYISSAGLRILLKIRKQTKVVFSVINVSPEVYDIFDTTGFTQLLNVEKRFRQVSIEGCMKIGEGGNGIVYQLDPETIVKVYRGERNDLEKIRKNREVTKGVFLHDVPTAMAFDLVKVGEGYGVVYEMINARSLMQVIAENPDQTAYYAEKVADMLIKLHSTEFEVGELPDAREPSRKDVLLLKEKGVYTEEEAARVLKLIDDIPARNTFIHQDFHPGNIMLQDGELVLIDVEDAGLGHPILDLSAMYLVYVTAAKTGWKFGEYEFGEKEFTTMWNVILKKYFGTEDEDTIREINRILKGYSLPKYIRGVATSPTVPDQYRKPAIEAGKKELFGLIDTLYPIPPLKA